MKKLRIAFLAYNLGQGGAERQLFYISRTLVQQGCIVDVFSFVQGGYWEAPLQKLGIRVISITEHGKVARLRKFIEYVGMGDYDYVHSQQFCTNLYAVAASLLCGVNCIGSIRNDVISEVRDPDMGLMGWFSLLLPTQMVANSIQSVENAKKYFRNPKTVYFLTNVVDTCVFFPGDQKDRTAPFKVITVGTVWKPKRIDRVVAIAEILKYRTNRKVIFEIYGDGDQLDFMKNLAESKNLLDSTLFFMGRSNDIASKYREANALLLTSDHEGTPNVVLEAMASGLPVIASKVGDIPEIITDGENGFSVQREDITKMANIIEALSMNSDLCSSIGKKAREFIVNSYSPERLAGQLAELYTRDGRLL